MTPSTEAPMFTGSISEFAALTGCDYATAAGVVKFLTMKRLATQVGNRPSPTGKGKPSIIYSFPNEVVLNFLPNA